MPTIEEMINAGFSFHQQGRLDEAEHVYTEALNLDKTNAEVYNLLGVIKLQKGDAQAAIEYVEKAVEKSPDAYFYETLFQAYIRNKNYNKIIAKEEVVTKLFPENYSLLFNIALAYKNLNKFKEAIKFYEKALKINPASHTAWFNLSHLYSIEAQTKNAVSALTICNKLKPDDMETEYFLSIALMRVKDYDKGLKYYEKRISKEAAQKMLEKTYPNKFRPDNEWKGQNIKDKTLLVYYEAGYGDVIMFSRYLPLAAKKCKKLIFYNHKALTPLFKENKHLGIDLIYDSYIPERDIDFDYHIAIMSLPHVLGLRGKNVFVSRGGYIIPNLDLAKAYREKYFMNDKIKVGIKWQGNTFYEKDRVIPTENFIPLTQVDNTQYYSFQTYEGSENTSKLPNVIDIGKDLSDFAQTAAALSNLDLVICNDTSLAHLAGAMRIPCWVLLPYEVNWRWHTDLSVCDWYESIKLFRQKSFGDWQSVFDEVLEEMKPD